MGRLILKEATVVRDDAFEREKEVVKRMGDCYQESLNSLRTIKSKLEEVQCRLRMEKANYKRVQITEKILFAYDVLVRQQKSLLTWVRSDIYKLIFEDYPDQPSDPIPRQFSEFVDKDLAKSIYLTFGEKIEQSFSTIPMAARKEEGQFVLFDEQPEPIEDNMVVDKYGDWRFAPNLCEEDDDFAEGSLYTEEAVLNIPVCVIRYNPDCTGWIVQRYAQNLEDF